MKNKIVFLVFVVLFFMKMNHSFSQTGSVDCSQVIKSEVLKQDMNYSVYLPPSCQSSTRSYPVLYLLHGMWGDHTSWITQGEADRIATEIMNRGEVPEMIIVMPNGFIDGFYINNYDNSVKWEDFFYKEFIPQVEKKYRILNDRNYRAIAGLSMGGYGALYHAINHNDMFTVCYALSAGVIEVNQLKDGETLPAEDVEFMTKLWGPINSEGFPTNYKKYSIQEILKNSESYVAPSYYEIMTGQKYDLPAITLDCGDDDFLFNENVNLVKIMKEKNIPVEFRVRQGAHTWDYWRSGLELALIYIGECFRN